MLRANIPPVASNGNSRAGFLPSLHEFLRSGSEERTENKIEPKVATEPGWHVDCVFNLSIFQGGGRLFTTSRMRMSSNRKLSSSRMQELRRELSTVQRLCRQFRTGPIRRRLDERLRDIIAEVVTATP